MGLLTKSNGKATQDGPQPHIPKVIKTGCQYPLSYMESRVFILL